MKIKFTWPSGKTRIETSYDSLEALIAGMFVNGHKPDDVKVESMEGEPKAVAPASTAPKSPAQPKLTTGAKKASK